MSRRRSLLKDGNDAKTFRHHRDRHLGHCVSNEYYQQTPFFFTRECAQLNLVGQYKGASAFLILNGPSVVSGDYDLSKLNMPGVITYGVNNGPATFRPTFWSCVDDPQRFLKSIWLDPRITKFVPHAHAEKPIFNGDEWKEMKKDGKKVLVGECPNCVFFHRNEKFEASRWLFEDKINWGNSGQYGGGRSVMLPALRILFLLGFRKVYLLGADFSMKEDYTYHFDERREKGAVRCNMNTYQKMKDEYYPSLQPYFKEEGFEVYNCNPNSGLKCFDYVPFETAIGEATGKLGEVFNERTWGMYCKPGDKSKTKDEPDAEDKPYLKNFKNRDELLHRARVEARASSLRDETPIQPEPVVRTEKVVSIEPQRDLEPKIVQKPKHRVVSVDNGDTVSTGSDNRVKMQQTDTSLKQVKVSPEVERIEEVPQSPRPPLNEVKSESKLIKRLPFRS